jgi:hypothetical protein
LQNRIIAKPILGLGIILLILPCGIPQKFAYGQTSNASPSNGFLAVQAAYLSLNKDASDGTGAPQVGLNSSYPTGEKDWTKAKAQYPAEAARFQPCVDKLQQAISLIKQVAPLTRPPISNGSLAKINANTSAATQLIAQARDCAPKQPMLQASAQIDQPNLPPDSSYGPVQPSNPGGGVTGGGGVGVGIGVGPWGGGPANGGITDGGTGGPEAPGLPPDWMTPDQKQKWYQQNKPINPSNGSYNACANPYESEHDPRCQKGLAKNQPPPPNPRPRPSTQPPSGNRPPFDLGQYVRGLTQGVQDCGQGLVSLANDLTVFGSYFGQGSSRLLRGDLTGDEFIKAANVLGLQPGQSVTLRGIAAEMGQQNLGVSPFDAGRLAGRRICQYGLIPGALKAAKYAGNPTVAGGSPLNPLKGPGVLQNSGNLAKGTWVSTPRGPIQLGAKLGADSKFGNVYEASNQPGKVIKISKPVETSGTSKTNMPADGGYTFPRQQAGSRELQRAGIPTPNIDFAQNASPGPSYMIMDNVNTKWPGARLASQIANQMSDLSGPEIQAIKNLYNKIIANNLVWPDGHLGNIFLYDGANGIEAGVLDADMIFPASEAAVQDAWVKDYLVQPMMQAGGFNVVKFVNGGYTSSEMMQTLWNSRFGGSIP